MTPTPHISAKNGDIAKTVLMPGDPLRAKYIAETYLKDIKLVSSVRNMLMYTGTFKGRKISVCASGMGQPSIGIYSYELFKFYGVENIVRVGSCGSYDKDLKLYDVVLAEKCWSDSSNFSQLLLKKDDHVAYPTNSLNNRLEAIAKEKGIKIKKEIVHSNDVFYSKLTVEEIRKLSGGANCVEMESYALFVIAKALNKNAACVLTVSDNLITKEETTSDQREKAFTKMMELALELA